MFKQLLLLSFSVFFINSYSQGNLQFNRVVNFSLQQANGGAYSKGVYTYQTFIIPAGKVWKIESVAVFHRDPDNTFELCIDCAAAFNDIVAVHFIRSGGVDDTRNLPIWLAEGTYNFIISDNNNSSQSDYLKASYTGIEFNIIP